MMYVDYVYGYVKHCSKGVDAIYEDYILHLVGITGLNSLKENGLLEACGIVNGRQLYALVKKES